MFGPAAERFLWRVSEPPMCEALRLFWLCGAGSGESTSDGPPTGPGCQWEISHWASSSVHWQPGIACRRKVSHRSSSYLVPKTARAQSCGDIRESGAREQAQALIAATIESDVCQCQRERVGGKSRQVIDKFLQCRGRADMLGGLGRALPFTSTSSCGNEKGRYSRCSGASIW